MDRTAVVKNDSTKTEEAKNATSEALKNHEFKHKQLQEWGGKTIRKKISHISKYLKLMAREL